MSLRTASENTAAIPFWVSIDDFCYRTGFSRSGTYLALQRKQLIARKIGKKVLINLPAALAWIEAQPEPALRQPA